MNFFNYKFFTLPIIALCVSNYAFAAGGESKPNFMLYLPIYAGFIALLYFALIRPQKQQQKKHQEMVSSLKLGEDVIAANGILGKIRGLEDKFVTLEVAEAVEIKVLRSQIQTKSS